MAIEVVAQKNHDGGRTWDRTCSREAWIPHGTEQDSYDAQMSLGFMYDEGQGVSEDDEETLRWYRRAAGRPL